jgi:hypothetical protein
MTHLARRRPRPTSLLGTTSRYPREDPFNSPYVSRKSWRGLDILPHIAIFVRGGVVQEVASNTPNVLIKLINMDAIEEGDAPDQWRPPDVVIADRERFEAYTSGGETP